MHCPYCANPVTETSPTCPSCNFSISGADQLFGEAPRLSLGINDHGGVLSPSDNQEILDDLTSMAGRYPQIRFSIITVSLTPDTSLPTMATWLLNRAGLFGDDEGGGANRGIVLLIDTANRRATVQTGYGLEPFIGYGHLEAVLDDARSDLEGGRFRDAITSMLRSVEGALESVHGELGDTYGLDMEAVTAAEARRMGLAAPVKSNIVATQHTHEDEY